ncbi:hypothetical protein SmJEL517_g04410 [Synchytrium microbalum]|uniref:ubiquitinyl hydrolase 1 n=1 Tax=Synchytrium microbalum TaxID=1806994 RepID=A0A507C528_9FUNG|nr:uncharacterized protein SmJEL517_g04410 [Synchytrium microbalum]TPX32535.1 hypothetical protein SmJEL517_g04410 [Synchytrium microbalum]
MQSNPIAIQNYTSQLETPSKPSTANSFHSNSGSFLGAAEKGMFAFDDLPGTPELIQRKPRHLIHEIEVVSSPSTDSSMASSLNSNGGVPAYIPNSVDERDFNIHQVTNNGRDREFFKRMQSAGYKIRRVREDGACLFRAVSDQLFATEERHLEVRKACMDYLEAHEDTYCAFLTDSESYADYIRRKRGPNCFVPYSISPFVAIPADATRIRLSYHRGIHYNSVVENDGTASIPSLNPGSLLTSNMNDDEFMRMQQAMLESITKETAEKSNTDNTTEEHFMLL